MSIEFKNSETKLNLLKAFAGESQARNRYTFAAGECKKQNLHVVESIFKFTADQEKEHAEIFYNYLEEFSGGEIEITGSYPIDITQSVSELLRYAERNENAEHDTVYRQFGDKAKEEGFEAIATTFYNIAKIEKTHGERFKCIAELIEQNKLFVNDTECAWICLNCGHIHYGKEAPMMCPVCKHDRGYFVRLDMMPLGISE